jgi:hypothetical protein
MALLVPELGPPDECFIWCYDTNTARQSRIFSFWGLDVDFAAWISSRCRPVEFNID